jgi:hypothetical protein
MFLYLSKLFCTCLALTRKGTVWLKRLPKFIYTLEKFWSKRDALNYCLITLDSWRVLLIAKTYLLTFQERTTKILDLSASYAMSSPDVVSSS